MNTRERIVIYAALALLGALNLSTVLGLGSPEAMAEPSTFADGLGPTSSLTLTGEEEPLVLRNSTGHLAWADNAHSQAYSMAFVAPGKAMEPLLQAEQYSEELQELQDELRTQSQGFEQRIGAYQQRNANVTPDDSRAAEVQQTFQAMLAEYEQWRTQATARMGLVRSGHIEKAYRDMLAAVEVVAERQGIDIVLRFIPTAEDFGAINPPQAYLATRQRLALVYPEALDITDAVLEELAIETE